MNYRRRPHYYAHFLDQTNTLSRFCHFRFVAMRRTTQYGSMNERVLQHNRHQYRQRHRQHHQRTHFMRILQIDDNFCNIFFSAVVALALK